MNSTGKFLVSALLVHAANLKREGESKPPKPAPGGNAPIRIEPVEPAPSSK